MMIMVMTVMMTMRRKRMVMVVVMMGSTSHGPGIMPGICHSRFLKLLMAL